MQITRFQGSPLSAQQAHLWSLQKSNQIYRTVCAIQIQGGLDSDTLKKALEYVIERHEILRTAFHFLPGMDIPMQVISEQALWSYTETSLQELTPPEQNIKIDELFAALQDETYDLQQGPLLLTQLLSLNARQHILLVGLPALSADTYSLKLFIDELHNAYMTLAPIEEPLQYADVSAWQEEQLLEEEATSQQEYWRKITQSQITDMKLPFQYEPSLLGLEANKDVAPQEVAITIPNHLAQKIEKLAQEHDASVSAWLLACWKILLWRLTDETTFPIGVACDGRNYEDLINALGPYTRFVPIEARFEKDRSFALVLAAVNASLLEAQKRQLYFTWDTIYGQAKDDATRHFFPVIYEYDACPATFEVGPLTFSLLKRWSYTEPFILKLSALQTGKSMHVDLHYDTQRITMLQAHTLANLFQTLLEQVTEQPQQRIGLVALFTDSERAHLLATFNGPRRSWSEQTLCQLFEAQVHQRPNELAVISNQEQLTYRQLNERANQLAQVLRQRGVKPNTVVGLCLTRQASMLVGLLGILKTGGAYLPLDVSHPQARLLYQLQESGALLLLTQEELRGHLPTWGGNIVTMEELAEELAATSPVDQSIDNQGDNLAYIIYTSGSTGAPKGVMISQRNVVNYTRALCEQLEAKPGWQYATVSTLAADLGNTAIFCSLASGGCVHVLEYDQVTSAEAMATWAEQHPIDVLKIVPSHLSALLEDERGQAFLPHQALVLGGEALPASLLERIRELGGKGAVYNHYGPTETTIGVLVNALAIQQESRDRRTIPLGHPIANTQAYILDGRMQLVPSGVRGELYIGGAGVAWGYLGQGGLTAERFVPNPYSQEQGARLYRTGDMVRYADGGQIEFMGRADGQVKLRGYRVEVGEIEAVLRQHPHVRECIVMLRNDGEPRLVSYIVSRQRAEIAREQLEAYMSEHLPAYMVPTEYVHLEEWPLTANGKVDRQRLPKPEQGIGQVKKGRTEARSPLEELTVQIWRDLVGAEIGIHDNFFAVGGNSLLATRVMARIRAVLQIELPVRAVFEAPTVASLAQRIERALREDADIHEPPLLAGTRPEELPLSFAQQRLWFLDQLEPESTAYLASRALKMEGVLNVGSLQHSLQELINRHESLRTTFAVQTGQPIQIIQPTLYAALPVIDLQELRQAHKENEVQRLVSQEAKRPCDLAQGPLIRTHLLRLAPQEHIMMLTMHHIITDGWSNEVLIHDLAALYQAFVNKQPSPLAPLPLQYADYALWQREWLQGELLNTQLTYWIKQLADVPSLELPFDYPRLSDHTYHGATLSLELPEALSQRLLALSQQEDVTLFMLLMAAFQALLMRYTGQTDISVNTPIANRTRAEIEGVIGFFVNTLVLRTDLSDNPTFLRLLKQVREVCLQAYAHQDVPFEKLVEILQPERDVSRSSLFQVSFQLADTAVSPQLIPGLNLELLGNDGASADFDLRVMIIKGPQGFSCMAFYDLHLFEAQTIHRFLAHFQSLLEQIVLLPEMPVAALPLLSEQERHLQLVEWNATQRTLPDELCLHQLFAKQVQRTPDRIALVFEEETLTYHELDRRANQLAHHLRKQGIGPDDLVGLCLPRSSEMMIGLLAILKASGAYVPLDASYPAARLQWLLRASHPRVVLTHSDLLPILTAAWPPKPGNGTLRAPARHLGRGGTLRAPSDPTQINSQDDSRGAHGRTQGVAPTQVPSSSQDECHFVCLDTQAHRWCDEPTSPVPTHMSADNLAYLIYTSGSTGNPKGVMCSHRAASNHLLWLRDLMDLDQQDRILQKAPLSFDASVTECFLPFLYGGAVVLARPDGQKDPAYLVEIIEREQISLIQFVPSLLRLWIEEPGIERCTQLRYIISAGETLSVDLQRRCLARCPSGIQLYNFYGPTEAATDVSYWMCQHEEEEQTNSTLPIGRPIANIQIYVLDHALQPVPLGVAGDVYLAGVGLARGYFQRPDLTAERFIPDPLGAQPGGRLYRTGDRGRLRADGAITYIGRVDEQVKLRGMRIEIGEIEAVLRAHPAVQEAIVILREDRPTDARLVAYIVLNRLHAETSNQNIQASQIRQHLQERLPDYMVPAHLMVLPALPLSPNGKLDRKALPAPETVHDQENNVQGAPGRPLEQLIGELWSEILGRKQIGIHENFFELGGHSLLVTQLVARMRAILGTEMPVRMAFEAPTIAKMAHWVEQAWLKSEQIEMPPLLAVARPEQIPLSFAQQRLWFLDQLTPNNTTYLDTGMLRFRGTLVISALESSIQEIVQRHENLRTTFMVRGEQPVQVIHPIRHVVLPIIDLQNLKPEQRAAEADALYYQEAQQPCNLATGPLFRTHLLRMEPEEHLMVLSLHHIITDGWSNNVLVRELSVLYRAHLTQQPTPLAPLPLQYADYALWQRQWLQGEMLQKHIAYWQQQLKGVSPLELPIDAARTATQSDEGARYTFELASDLSAALVAFSHSEGVTLFMTMLAAFQVLLYRLSGQADIVVGTDVANRTHVETEELIGFFINLLALRTDLQGAPSFRKVMQQVRTKVLEAYTHQELPFALVVEHVQHERKEHTASIVQVLLVLQNMPKSASALPGIELETVYKEEASARFDLALFLQEEEHGITGSVVYRAALFKKATIATWMRQFTTLLNSIVTKPDTTIDMLELYTDEEKAIQTQQKQTKNQADAKRIRSTKSKSIEIR